MNKKQLFIILFFSTFAVIGQNISGAVLDAETNAPIENATVYFKKENSGTVTDDKGRFELKIPSKINPSDTIRFSIIGYAPKNYSFSKLEELHFIIHLSKQTENLKEVTVTSKRELNPRISFKKLSPLVRGVYDFGSVLINGKIYVIGGDESYYDDKAMRVFTNVASTSESKFKDLINGTRANFYWGNYNSNLQVYDIEKDTWTISKLKFQERAYHNINYFDGKIYVLGGKTLSTNRQMEYLDDKIEVLDLNTNQIITDNANPHQAVNFASFTYQDNIIVMGGSIKQPRKGKKVYSDKSHIYNITSGFWYELPKMNEPKEANGIIVNNKIYLIGGFHDVPLLEIESYDLSAGKWNNEGDLFDRMENPALTFYDNTIYIFDDGNILTYNIESKILNEYDIDLKLKDARMHCYKNDLYILGGFTEEDYTIEPSPNVYSIDLTEFYKTKIINSKKVN